MVNIDKIKMLAKEQGIKIKYICSCLGLAETYLSNVKNGKDRMTEERLAKIADILHTTPEYLTDQTEQKEKPTVNDGERDALERDIMELLDSLSPEKRERAIDYLKYLSNSK